MMDFEDLHWDKRFKSMVKKKLRELEAEAILEIAKELKDDPEILVLLNELKEVVKNGERYRLD